jgi:predicted unusual protein kinase regulating ubiquinone biosynthesis (AarF/ABC1/UbiB family)
MAQALNTASHRNSQDLKSQESNASSFVGLAAVRSERHSYRPEIADNFGRAERILPVQFLLDLRFWQIFSAFLVFLVKWFKTFAGKNSQTTASQRYALSGKHLREFFQDLGPAFIKIGQFLSSRTDLMPQEIAAELGLLQDHVLPMPYLLVEHQITHELGIPRDTVFAWIDPNPLASASIGQVHKAKLRSGELCVIKIQRPELREMLYRDLGYAKAYIRLIKFFRSSFKSQLWLDLFDQFGHTLFAEIDYIQEAQHSAYLRHFFRYRPDIKIARTFWRYTTRKLIVSEYLPGIKVSRVNQLVEAEVNLNKLAHLIVDFYAEQILFADYYHADPHAGNLAVDSQGNLIVYDFGMVAALSQNQKDSLAGCIRAAVEADLEGLARNLINLGVIAQEIEQGKIVKRLQTIISYWSDGNLSQTNRCQLDREIDLLLKQNFFVLPANLAYLVRTGTCLEGITRLVEPKFQFGQALQPYLGRWAIHIASNWGGGGNSSLSKYVQTQSKGNIF